MPPRKPKAIDTLRRRIDDVPPAAIVRSVRLTRGAPARCTISVGTPGDKPASFTLDALDAESMRLEPGAPWSPELASRIREAIERDRARRDALATLARAPMSRRRLETKLRDKGHTHEAAALAADHLIRLGLLDDAALADSAARSMMNRQPAGARLIENKLRAKGIDPAAARDAARKAAQDRDPLEDATALAKKKLRSMPASLDAQARRRRVYAALARRGFDADVCRNATDAALAPTEDESLD